jgi:hypothetical protein
MRRHLRGYLRLFRTLYLRRVGAVALALYLGLLNVLPLRDYYISSRWQARLHVANLPDLSLWHWLAIGLTFALLVGFVGAYEEIQKYQAGDIEGTIGQLEREVIQHWPEGHNAQTDGATTFRRCAPQLAARGISSNDMDMVALGSLPFDMDASELTRCLERWRLLGLVDVTQRAFGSGDRAEVVRDYYLSRLGRQVAATLGVDPAAAPAWIS